MLKLHHYCRINEVRMQNGMLALIRDGQSYSKIWPLRPELAPLFSEFRIIKATRLGLSLLPMVAAVSLAVQVKLLGHEYLPQAIAFALFMVSLPMQGLYWLGKRANTVLPMSVASWYRKIHEKMASEGCQVPFTQTKPRYRELAELLKHAFDKMDKAFTKELF
ncbi:MAG: uncharacterized membrane protein YfbV (UPF0208 family) [Alteromonadaceae bacterium]|jgi:uncharacterized membrane protein YfbV (UPF0208 family)